MKAVDLIAKKRDKQQLTKAEIDFFVNGFATGEIPDYQVSAWAMAVLLNGMSDEETIYLTQAMVESGEKLDLHDIVRIAVDKHSTGGVGDKTTFVVTPIAAACGQPVAKMSGRGLGFSGGTLDKFDAIPGFRSDLSVDEFKRRLRETGIVVTGQNVDLAPADGKLYAIRDVTGTVPSIPLIASSVMSKKLASGADVIVLDVKVGLGAFMTTLEDAQELARLMVKIGTENGRKVIALLANMDQPLGHAVGNALELREAIDTLLGNGPVDFTQHCLEVASYMLFMAGHGSTQEEAFAAAQKSLLDGSALRKLKQMVTAQGGDGDYIDHPEKLPQAKIIEIIPSPESGYLSEINARIVGDVSVNLGAGRAKKDDAIDLSVGLIIPHKVGDYVTKGQPLLTIHASSHDKLEDMKKQVVRAFIFSKDKVDPAPLFFGVVN